MSVREYIGARYVPLFADPLTWDATRTYEPLTVVLYQGNSYTSRQAVPANIDISNTTYWAQTGNYNAQIEQYRAEVQGFSSRIDATEVAISAEATARGNADTALGQLIQDETTARENADTALGQLIQDEATARGNADTALGQLIQDETTARGNADTALGQLIQDEATARENADTALGRSIQGLQTQIDENKMDAFYTRFDFTYVDASNGSDTDGNGTSANPYATLQHAFEALVGAGNRDVRLRLASGNYKIEARAVAGLAIHMAASGPNVIVEFDTGNNASQAAASFNFYNCHINIDGYNTANPITLKATQSLGLLIFETANVSIANVLLQSPLYLRQCKCSLNNTTLPNINAAASDITVRNNITLTDNSGIISPLVLQDGCTWNDDGNAYTTFPSLNANSNVAAIICRGSNIYLYHQLPYMTETPQNKWLYSIDANMGSIITCPNIGVYNYMNNTTIQMSQNGARIRNGSNVFASSKVYQ